MNTTDSVSEILTNTNNTNRVPIGLNKTKLIPIGNRITTSVIVDKLLEDYKELILPGYIHWFAKKFYNMPFETIHRLASEARNDGKDPKRLFAYLVNKTCG